MNAAQLLVRCLEHEGIDLLFGVPGEENLDVLDRVPLVAITGQASLDRMHKESHQAIDVRSIFRPVSWP